VPALGTHSVNFCPRREMTLSSKRRELLPARNYLVSTDGVRHGHPSPESLQRLAAIPHCQGKKIWLTYPLFEKLKETLPDTASMLEFVGGTASGAGIDIS
jgi:hypothetical protein